MKKLNKKKKIILICFAAMLVFGAAAWYLLYVNPIFEASSSEGHTGTGASTGTGTGGNKVDGMYGSRGSRIFYPIDDELDIESVREYAQLDRQIYYTYGAETVALDETDLEGYGDDIRFFADYFDTVISGDYTKYNTLFTEEYFKKNEKTCDFTAQMLYDIRIEKLSEETENGKKHFGYNVSYKIFRNNGTFRNDIGSDGSRTLYFSLVWEDGRILIDYIDYYV